VLSTRLLAPWFDIGTLWRPRQRSDALVQGSLGRWLDEILQMRHLHESRLLHIKANQHTFRMRGSRGQWPVLYEADIIELLAFSVSDV
jgi:hypothetical protein